MVISDAEHLALYVLSQGRIKALNQTNTVLQEYQNDKELRLELLSAMKIASSCSEHRYFPMFNAMSNAVICLENSLLCRREDILS